MMQVYFDPYPNKVLEKYITDYGAFLKERGERPVSVRRVETVDEVLAQSDVRTSLLCTTLSTVMKKVAVYSCTCPRTCMAFIVAHVSYSAICLQHSCVTVTCMQPV